MNILETNASNVLPGDHLWGLTGRALPGDGVRILTVQPDDEFHVRLWTSSDSYYLVPDAFGAVVSRR